MSTYSCIIKISLACDLSQVTFAVSERHRSSPVLVGRRCCAVSRMMSSVCFVHFSIWPFLTSWLRLLTRSPTGATSYADMNLVSFSFALSFRTEYTAGLAKLKLLWWCSLRSSLVSAITFLYLFYSH